RVGERPAAVAADWYAARHGVARARVKPLQQDRLSAREGRVLVLAAPGRGEAAPGGPAVGPGGPGAGPGRPRPGADADGPGPGAPGPGRVEGPVSTRARLGGGGGGGAAVLGALAAGAAARGLRGRVRPGGARAAAGARGGRSPAAST